MVGSWWLIATLVLAKPCVVISFAAPYLGTDSVYVVDDDGGAFQSEAGQLACKLGIPLLSQVPRDAISNFRHSLRLVPFKIGRSMITYAVGLEAVHQSTGRRKPPRVLPFIVDFSQRDKASKNDLLVRAVGPKRCGSQDNKGAVIYDMTAGYGRDAKLLATSGASLVVLMERNPIMASMLQDALRRLELEAASSSQGNSEAWKLLQRLRLRIGDSTQLVKRSQSSELPPADVIYLDPMFPPRTKSAAVKKNMQLLHRLLDTQDRSVEDEKQRDLEETRLLEVALKAAKTRVVVKRPLRVPPLASSGALPRPSYSLEGSCFVVVRFGF